MIGFYWYTVYWSALFINCVQPTEFDLISVTDLLSKMQRKGIITSFSKVSTFDFEKCILPYG